MARRAMGYSLVNDELAAVVGVEGGNIRLIHLHPFMTYFLLFSRKFTLK